MIRYIGKVINDMSPLEIVIYSILGAIIIGMCFKWFIYDTLIKPKKAKKKEIKEKVKIPEEEE